MSRLPQPKFDRTFTVYGSSLINGCQYDPSKGILDLTMTNGARYRYRGINTSDFADFITSKSPGKVYNSRIKGKGSVKLKRRW